MLDAAAKEWAALPYSKSDCDRRRYPDCGAGNSYYESSTNHAVAGEAVIAVFEACLDVYQQSGQV